MPNKDKTPSRRLFGDLSTPITMALIIWMCTLPLLALLALPALGWERTGLLAGSILLVDLIGCWLLLAFHHLKSPSA